jgi:hypothetical protein
MKSYLSHLEWTLEVGDTPIPPLKEDSDPLSAIGAR